MGAGEWVAAAAAAVAAAAGTPATRAGDGASRLGETLAAQKVLTISHKDPELVIRDLNGRSRTFFTDARKVEEERSEGTAKVQTKWKDRSIVVVTKLGDREDHRRITNARPTGRVSS